MGRIILSITIKVPKAKLEELGIYLNQLEGYPNLATKTNRYAMEEEEDDDGVKHAYLLPDTDEARVNPHIPQGCKLEKGDTRKPKKDK